MNLNNKLNSNIISIVKSYLLPLTENVKNNKYKCICFLIYKTNCIRLCLDSNVCCNESGEMCYGLKYGKIKNINNSFWSIRRES